jgi:glutathione synthase/RimK-type ligase-like ATP-grasp enzyme
MVLTGTDRKNSAYKTTTALNNMTGALQCDLVKYEDVLCIIDDAIENCLVPHLGTSISDYDLIYIHGVGGEDMRSIIAEIAKSAGIPCLNQENLGYQYINKANQYLAFKRAGLPIPYTMVGYPKVLRETVAAEGVATSRIVKLANGSNGNDNFLVNSARQFDDCATSEVYVMQPFIPNDYDYRVIVAGNKAILSYKRTRDSSKTHVNNVRKGATRDFGAGDLPDDIEQLAVAASKAVNREISGVDILVAHSGEKYILESNFNYGLPKMEDIPKSYFSHLEDYILSYNKAENSKIL